MSNQSLLSSPETEKMAISASIASMKNLCSLIQNLRVTDFTDLRHQEVFFLLEDVYKTTENIGVHVICEKAKNNGMLEKIGGLSILLSILTSVSYPDEIESYIELLKEKSARRETLAHCENIVKILQSRDLPVAQIHDELRDKIYKIESRSSTTEFKTINQILDSYFDGKSYLDNIQDIQNSKRDTSISGIETGFNVLDEMIGGLQDGNLILLAARPGMGKTTFALNIFENICITKNIPSLFVPLEMNSIDILEKIISSKLSIDYKKLREATITPNDFQNIVVFMREQYKAYITDKPSFNINTLRSAAIRAKDAFGIKLLIIDYLQLLRGSERTRNENKYQEISEISMSLKNLARELNIPIICLSQLSRKVEERLDQMPILSDLRDSGSLEADADIVLFLYRWDHKDPNLRPGQARLIVSKNRRGQTGEISFKHNLGLSRFDLTDYKTMA